MADETRETGRAGEGPPSKQAVYGAAIRLFARNGFAATGMRELAREAGVNLAMVNYFFGSKKGLLKAILEDYFSGVTKVLEANLSGPDPLEDRLHRTVVAVARYVQANSDKMLIGLTELPHDDPDITEFKAQWFGRLHAMFQDGFRAAAPHIPVGVIGPALVGLVASRHLMRPVVERVIDPDMQETADAAYPELIADLFVYGVSGLTGNLGNRHA